MKLVIFGATGSVGRHLVGQALAAGHQVSAFARSPQKLDMDHPNLTLVAGDVMDREAVSAAVMASDAVLVTLGSKKLTGFLRSRGTLHIVEAMQKHGVKRLVCQTTLGIGDSYGNLDFFWKYVMFGTILRAVFKDHGVQEGIVQQSGLDWVIVRPAAFTDGAAQGLYKHGFGANEANLSLKISRADIANFMLGQISDDRYLHQTPGLSDARMQPKPLADHATPQVHA